MANGVDVRLNLRGLNVLMTGTEVTGMVARTANSMAAEAGSDFEANVVPHKWTARAFIRAANAKGAARQARDRVLERTLHAR